MSNTTYLPITNVLAVFGRRLQSIFNWGDPQWGRPANSDNNSKDQKDTDEQQAATGNGGGGDDMPPEHDPDKRNDEQKKSDDQKKEDGPPDLDEIWKDVSNKLGGIFGGGNKKQGKPPSAPSNDRSRNAPNQMNDDREDRDFDDGWGSGSRQNRGNGGNNGNGGGNKGFDKIPRPRMPQMGSKGGVLLIVLALAGWMTTGFFTVKEGRQAVILTFGKPTATVGPGLHWRWPQPIEMTIEEAASKLRTANIGANKTISVTGLSDTAMLTKDKSIVDVDFTVQYLITDLNEYLFENVDPEAAVIQAAEAAVRDVAGRSLANDMLKDERQRISHEIKESIQSQLNILNIGIKIDEVNIKNVVVPSQVQPAVDDVLKANSERTSLINEGEIYASQKVPLADGKAARLKANAQAYKAKVVAEAEGDSQRFSQVYVAYKDAPEVTRERMYLETMQEIFSNVTKVVVDSQNNSLLYLPLDKIMNTSDVNVQSNVSDISSDTKLIEQRVISGGAVSQQKTAEQTRNGASVQNEVSASSGFEGRQTRY